MEAVRIKRALISVSDKSQLDILAPHLLDWDITLIASGGTQKHLESLGLAVTPIESITKSPVAFSGRVKTISFQIAASLLFNRDSDADTNEAKTLNIEPIDLLICNLYPFSQKMKENLSLEEMIEFIDIGGPTLIRSAAKNFHSVCVCTDPNDYPALAKALNAQGTLSHEFRYKQAKKAFAYTAHYESDINHYFNESEQPLTNYQYRHPLRYGENPQQIASIITQTPALPQTFNSLQGKPLSYNNLLDLQAALYSMKTIHTVTQQPSITIIKHGNPCGASASDDLQTALFSAWEADPISAFGSVVASSHPLNAEQAEFFSDRFIEIIVAPDFTQDALDILKNKSNLRVIRLNWDDLKPAIDYRNVLNCLLAQNSLDTNISTEHFKSVTEIEFPEKFYTQAKFGIAIVQYLKSNAIAIVSKNERGYQLLGTGMGNPNRLISVEQAIQKAKQNGHTNLSNAILVSDGFFPFTDNVEYAYHHGVQQIVQPGGSIKDKEIIEYCDQLGIKMLLTGQRYFLH